MVNTVQRKTLSNLQTAVIRRTCASLYLTGRVLTCIMLGTPNPAHAEQLRDLIVWVVPTDFESPLDTRAEPTRRQNIDNFFDNIQDFFQNTYHESIPTGLQVEDIRRRLLEEPEFADQVIQQRMIFRELAHFIRDAEYSGRIIVSFLDWVELLDVLENLPPGLLTQWPDVVVAPSTWIAHLAHEGVLVPLELAPEQLSEYREEPLRGCRVRMTGRDFADNAALAFGQMWGDEKLYALPWLVDVRLFFYWRDKFPHMRFANREQFADALVAAREAHASDDFIPFALAGQPDWDLLHSFSLLLWGAGGDWMQGGAFLPSNASDQALTFLEHTVSSHGTVISHGGRYDLEKRFRRGEIGSLISGPWMIRWLREDQGENWSARIGVDLPPLNASGLPKSTYLGGLDLGLTPRGREHPSALKVMEFLTTQGDAQYFVNAVAVPASKTAFHRLQDSFSEASGIGALLDRAIAAGRQFPPIPQWAASVEAQATRIELFYLFKHVRDYPLHAAGDLAALRRRLDFEISGRPRALLILGILAAVMLLLILFTWQRIERGSLAGISVSATAIILLAACFLRSDYLSAALTWVAVMTGIVVSNIAKK